MGEKQQVLRTIEHIEKLVEELPTTREHLGHLDKFIKCAPNVPDD